MDRSEAVTVAERGGGRLVARGEDLATVESCTGGLLGSTITDVPGASGYYDRGYVTYSNRAKLNLGVSRETLEGHGAVSEPAAREMAQAARDTAGTTWSISTTGIAGPSGGTPEKPVGTVYVAIAHAGPWGTVETDTTVKHRVYDGSRTEIKTAVVAGALSALEAALDRFGGQ
jgi:nicotinamide-nucleotide amidase